MNTTVGLIYRNSSSKFLLVKIREDQASKKKSNEASFYNFPTLALGEEDTKEFAVDLLKIRLIECNEELSREVFLSHESDDSNVDFYYLSGDYEISKSFYEFYDSYLLVGIEEFENLTEISDDAKLVFTALKYIDVAK